MHDRTRVLKLLDPAICSALLSEALGRTFGPHARGRYAGTCPLRHGRTAYIRDLGSRDDAVYEDNLRHFPVFRSFIRSVFDADQVGKSYWHRLKPGMRIYPHLDYSSYYERTDRFQLFPRADDRNIGLIEDAEERYASGTLIAFRPANLHAYENRSENDWVFLVFDLYPGHYSRAS